MYRFDGNLESLGFLRYDVTNIAYAIPNLKTGAVIGVGGGRDVLSQRLYGLSDVTGVEINPIIIDALRARFADYTTIAALDGVRFEVDEARSWFARTPRSFDVIQMSLIDTWAATGAGAFTLTENGLYTVEAWQRFLGRLNPGGLFTVSRWYAPGEVNETGRLVSLAVATLIENGAGEPRRHLFLATAGNVATLIVTKSPVSPAALAALKGAASANAFTVLLSPDTAAPSEMLENIVTARDRPALDHATASYYLDLTPPTDARPFFFNQLRFATLLDPGVFARFTHSGVFSGNLIATLTLAMLVLISLALVAATIIVPLRPTVREAGWALAAGGTAYFALIGSGFMMIEIALLAADERFSRSSRLRAERRPVQPDPMDRHSVAWHRSACLSTGPASSPPGAWRSPPMSLPCLSGCRRCSPSTTARTFPFAPGSVSLPSRRPAC